MMTDNPKEIAKKRTEMLAALRKEHHDKVKIAQALLKEQQTIRRQIKRALQSGAKSVPQLAQETGLSESETLWHVAAMKKYGDIAEAGLDEDYEYYLYRLSLEGKK